MTAPATLQVDTVAGPLIVTPATGAAILRAECERMAAAIALQDQHRRLKIEMAQRGLPPAAGALTRSQLVRLVAEAHDLTADALRGPDRGRTAAWPRQEAMYVLSLQTRPADGAWRWSYTQIGAALGGRDHSTVIFGIRRHCERHGIPHVPRQTHSSGAGPVA